MPSQQPSTDGAAAAASLSWTINASPNAECRKPAKPPPSLSSGLSTCQLLSDAADFLQESTDCAYMDDPFFLLIR